MLDDTTVLNADRQPDPGPPHVDIEWIKARIKEFERCAKDESENRTEAVDDLRFKAGDQWPTSIKTDREAEGRPCITVNSLPAFVNQVVNPMKENRPGIKFRPRGSKSSQKSSEILQGVVRQIEYDCDAEIAYDNGYQCAVDIGWGYWRVCTKYENDESFDQVITIEPIWNPLTVYMDPESKQPDGSDCEWCFITKNLKKEAFKEKYPDASIGYWQTNAQGDSGKEWIDAENIRVAEYFWYEKKERVLIMLKNGAILYRDEYTGSETPIMTREVTCKTVKWRRFTALEVLDEKDWDGYCIPVVKVIGNQIINDNKKVLKGLIRDAKGPQQMYNFWSSAESEHIALQPKAPFVAAEGQVENYQDMWKSANRKNYGVLIYKPMALGGRPVPPPTRVAPPPISQGIVTAKMGAREDLKHTTGIYDPSLGMVSNERTGRAIQARQGQADVGHFHYLDNFCKSLIYTGKILVDLIPKVYDTPRIVSIVGEDGSAGRVQLDTKMQNAYTPSAGGQPAILNPEHGEYDVVVVTGPSYVTKRMEAAASMMDFVKAVPNAGQLIGDLIAKNMDWPGASEVATRLAKSLPPHMLQIETDTPPQAQAMIAGLQNQMKQLMQTVQQLSKIAQDQDKDREVQTLKILSDYEAKMAKIQSDMQKSVEDRFSKLIDSVISHQSAAEQRQHGTMEKIVQMLHEKDLASKVEAKAQSM